MQSNTSVENLVQIIKTDIQKSNQYVNQIQNINQQFKGRSPSQDIRDKIFSIEKNVKTLINSTKTNLQELNSRPQSKTGDIKLQKERLTDEMIKTVQKFKTVLQSSLDLLDQAPSGVAYSNSNLIIENESSAVRYNNTDMGGYQSQAQVSTQLVDQVIERNNQMKNLERDIVDLNSMFKDLSLLVHEQGETIDTIENNIDSAREAVVHANVELVKGVKYQSKARTKKCLIILLVLIVLIVIVVVTLVVLHPWSK